MFHQLIQHKRDEWFASPDCTVGDVIAYIARRGMMRDAQIEAIKTYLYLKIACGNRPLWKLYHDGAFNTLDTARMPLTGNARNAVENNPAAAALLEYALLKDRKDKPIAPTLGSVITAWVLEGHIVEIPGLGNIRAEVRAKAQYKPGDVTESDIFRRKLLLTPTKEIKDALNATPVRITCCDREGDEVKR